MSDPNTPFVLLPGKPAEVVLLSGRLASAGEQEVYLILGNCMEPTLLPGDRLRIHTTAGSVGLGWIVVFPWGDKLLAHRVVKVRGREFWARGDSAAEEQGPVLCEHVLGRVVAIQRDGKWKSLQGWAPQISGILYNLAMKRIRVWAKRWPNLRKWVELDVLGGRFSRKMFRMLGTLYFGDVQVEVEKAAERLFCILASDAPNRDTRFVQDFEELSKREDIKLFVARSARQGLVGNVAVNRLDLGDGVPTGYVSTLRVTFGARGMGIGRMLLSALERDARREGLRRLLSLVGVDNLRSLSLFQSMGYWVATGDERMQTVVPLFGHVGSDMILLLRTLGEMEADRNGAGG